MPVLKAPHGTCGRALQLVPVPHQNSSERSNQRHQYRSHLDAQLQVIAEIPNRTNDLSLKSGDSIILLVRNNRETRFTLNYGCSSEE